MSYVVFVSDGVLFKHCLLRKQVLCSQQHLSQGIAIFTNMMLQEVTFPYFS